MHEWQARVVDDGRDFASGRLRLLIWRNLGERTEQVTGFTDDGDPVITGLGPGIAASFRGFALPSEVFDTLAEHLKPGASTGEVARLEEALAVERRRVDDLLAVLRNTSTPG